MKHLLLHEVGQIKKLCEFRQISIKIENPLDCNAEGHRQPELHSWKGSASEAESQSVDRAKSRPENKKNGLFSTAKTFQLILLIFMSNAHVLSWAANAGNSPTEIAQHPGPWVQTFSVPVRGGYSLKSIAGSEPNVAAVDIVIVTGISTNYCKSQLVTYSNKRLLGSGFVLKVEGNEVFPNFEQSCYKILGRKPFRKEAHWPKCEQKSALESTWYFVFESNERTICLYEPPDAGNYGKSNPRKVSPEIQSIDSRWKAEQPTGSVELLGYFFPTAPYWQGSLGSYEQGMNARACNRYANAIGAFQSKTQPFKTPYLEKELPNGDLRWAFQYLVRIDGGYRCGDTRYLIDLIARPLAYLSDGTVLLYGNRAVLRVRLEDGSTDASASTVKRLEPRMFIEQLQADGDPGCLVHDEKVQCKWLRQQGWYVFYRQARQKAKGGGELDEGTIGKFWFQGFDQAIQRIYFGK